MTLDDLNHALRQTIDGGKIGTPVALRMHLQFSDDSTDQLAVIAGVIERANGLFASGPSRCMVRSNRDQQVTALISYAAGQTLFVTVGRGVATQSQTHLLLIGNHGVANLDGLEFDEAAFCSKDEESASWRGLLQASLDGKQAVDIGDVVG